MEKFLAENPDKISGDDKDAANKGIEEVREALKGEDTELIKTKSEALMQVFQRIGTAMHQQQQGQAGAGGPGEAGAPGTGSAESESSGDGDVVEGEIVDEGTGS